MDTETRQIIPDPTPEQAKGKVIFQRGEKFALKGCLFVLEHAEGDRIVMRFLGAAQTRQGLRAERRKAERNKRKKERKNR